MIKVENIEVFNFEGAIRGMRNPKNSWDRSDSDYGACGYKGFEIGENDIDLMRRLYKAGTEHRKYLRQIFASMDITAPLYWWKEFDTYKVGTVTNSCSTMHKLPDKEFVIEDFSCEHLVSDGIDCLINTINNLNEAREIYLNYENVKDKITQDIKSKKDIWWQMIQLLPSSYNQRRTVTMNYENVMSIINQRTGHKLDEWNDFVKVLNNLPYVEVIRSDEVE